MNAASINVGQIERVLRVVIGVALLAAIILLEHPAKWIGLIGAVPLLTGVVGWCPLYAWFTRD